MYIKSTTYPSSNIPTSINSISWDSSRFVSTPKNFMTSSFARLHPTLASFSQFLYIITNEFMFTTPNRHFCKFVRTPTTLKIRSISIWLPKMFKTCPLNRATLTHLWQFAFHHNKGHAHSLRIIECQWNINTSTIKNLSKDSTRHDGPSNKKPPKSITCVSIDGDIVIVVGFKKLFTFTSLDSKHYQSYSCTMSMAHSWPTNSQIQVRPLNLGSSMRAIVLCALSCWKIQANNKNGARIFTNSVAMWLYRISNSNHSFHITMKGQLLLYDQH